MSEYIVSARKYRPLRFTEMVGQEQVAVTLKNAIRTGHLAHSFLFCGPRGVGKTTAARILAKTINCENINHDFEACGTCSSCISFQQNSSFNIHELDAASNNSVEDIRSLVDQVRFPPQSGKYKIYIIDEVHMLSAGAFNAFLKTLEEPPSYCKFILATTEKHKILPTILSRCQIFDFRRIGVEVIVNHLRHICETEKVDAEDEALHIIAQKADGGMRDALSMFDRLSGFSGGKLTYASVLENLNVLDYDYFFKVTEALLVENVSGVFQLFDEILKKGFEGDDFIIGLCEHFRHLLFCKDNKTLALLETSVSLKQRYSQQTSLTSADFLVNCLHLGNQCDVQYKTSKNKRLTVELALVKMCYVNAVVAVSAEGSKKKLFDSEVKNTTTNKATQFEATPKINEVNEPAITITQKIATADTEIENKQAENVIVTSSPPSKKTSTIVGKSKKLLTVDSYTESPKENTQQVIKEVTQETEVSILTQENVELVWGEYGAQLPEEKKGIKIAFSTFIPVLDNENMNAITVTVQSDIQKKQFEEVSKSLERFLLQRFGAPLNFLIIADKASETGAKPYTPKEKLERLIEKNPALKIMQKQFGLELDYD